MYMVGKHGVHMQHVGTRIYAWCMNICICMRVHVYFIFILCKKLYPLYAKIFVHDRMRYHALQVVTEVVATQRLPC